MTNIEIGAIVASLLLAAIGFWAGRRATPKTDALPTAGDPSTVAELARLKERERHLSEQLSDLTEKNSRLTAEVSALTNDLGAAREKAAADDQKVNSLTTTLERERSQNDSVQQRLSANLVEQTTAKERLSADLTEHAQHLAAARQLEPELRGQIDRAIQHITDRDNSIKELRSELHIANAAVSTRESELAAARQLEPELRGQIARGAQHIADRDTTIKSLQTDLSTAIGTISARNSELSAAAERESALNRTIAERDEQLQGLQQKLKDEFEAIANKVLKASTDQLAEKSKESLTPILDPLRDRIIEFRNKVEATHIEDTRQRSALETQIGNIVKANHAIGEQAENLAKALKGDSQLRGRWGEVRLERILESSGLVRNREFVVQGGDFNIKGEDGGSQRPDVIVLLPEERHFVIDSKVSLVDYLEYAKCENDPDRSGALKKLLQSIKGHIDGLAGKNYQYASAINSHDLVFMFIPIEGVASLVMEHDDQILEYAWKRKIVMVSPSTLFMAMQTVQSIWRYEHQSENAQAIADQAGQLYDKLVGVVADLNDVSQKIGAAADAHGEAMKKLSTGKGNALGRAQRLKSLGVSSKKEIPAIILGGERYPVEADEEDQPQKLEEMRPAAIQSNEPTRGERN